MCWFFKMISVSISFVTNMIRLLLFQKETFCVFLKMRRLFFIFDGVVVVLTKKRENFSSSSSRARFRCR